MSLNNLITLKEIDKKGKRKKDHLMKETLGRVDFMDECYQNFKEQIISILYKLFQTIEKEEMFSN